MVCQASRVCAWCGASDGLTPEDSETTTHGLCRRCLAERVSEPSEREGDPAGRPDDCDGPVESSTRWESVF